MRDVGLDLGVGDINTKGGSLTSRVCESQGRWTHLYLLLCQMLSEQNYVL